jgi:hypothetical protein
MFDFAFGIKKKHSPGFISGDNPKNQKSNRKYRIQNLKSKVG